jgi:serum/glucocorticoid-regulated kinase 2
MEPVSPLDDYAMLSVIGKGSYAKVVLVRKKASGQLYALKSMKKKYIEKKNQVKRVMMERDILAGIDHSFLVRIHASFHDDKKLFLVLEYCPGGELFGLLSKRKRLNEFE